MKIKPDCLKFYLDHVTVTSRTFQVVTYKFCKIKMRTCPFFTLVKKSQPHCARAGVGFVDITLKWNLDFIRQSVFLTISLGEPTCNDIPNRFTRPGTPYV